MPIKMDYTYSMVIFISLLNYIKTTTVFDLPKDQNKVDSTCLKNNAILHVDKIISKIIEQTNEFLIIYNKNKKQYHILSTVEYEILKKLSKFNKQHDTNTIKEIEYKKNEGLFLIPSSEIFDNLLIILNLCNVNYQQVSIKDIKELIELCRSHKKLEEAFDDSLNELKEEIENLKDESNKSFRKASKMCNLTIEALKNLKEMQNKINKLFAHKIVDFVCSIKKEWDQLTLWQKYVVVNSDYNHEASNFPQTYIDEINKMVYESIKKYTDSIESLINIIKSSEVKNLKFLESNNELVNVIDNYKFFLTSVIAFIKNLKNDVFIKWERTNNKFNEAMDVLLAVLDEKLISIKKLANNYCCLIDKNKSFTENEETKFSLFERHVKKLNETFREAADYVKTQLQKNVLDDMLTKFFDKSYLKMTYDKFYFEKLALLLRIQFYKYKCDYNYVLNALHNSIKRKRSTKLEVIRDLEAFTIFYKKQEMFYREVQNKYGHFMYSWYYSCENLF